MICTCTNRCAVAVAEGNKRLAVRALNLGADPALHLPAKRYEKSLLRQAMHKGKAPLVELLAEDGRAGRHGEFRIALSIALHKPDARLCKVLLKHGADPNEPYAEHRDAPALVELLTWHEVGSQSEGLETKMLATAKALLVAGADPNGTDKNGLAPLDVLAREKKVPGAPDLIRLIGARGGNAYRPAPDGISPIDTIRTAKNFDINTYVRRAFADIELKSAPEQLRAAFKAAKKGNAKALKACLSKAEPGWFLVRDEKLHSILDHAAAGDHADLCLMLVAAGAPIDGAPALAASSTTPSPLHRAAGAGAINAMKWLLDNGSKPDGTMSSYGVHAPGMGHRQQATQGGCLSPAALAPGPARRPSLGVGRPLLRREDVQHADQPRR